GEARRGRLRRGAEVTALRVHIDTDPGLDDLLALAFALASPELSVEGITTVAGNAALEAVTENALRFVALAGVAIPVGAGAAGPLALKAIDASHFHGADGRRGVALAPHGLPPARSADAVLRRSLVERRVERVIALGPLTNVAALLETEPELFRDTEIVWMGGTLGRGNVTPLAEFNAYADPRALQIALDSGVRLRVIGLDVTERVLLRVSDLPAPARTATPRARMIEGAVRALCRAERELSGAAVAYLHDPCAVAASFAPELFTFAEKGLRACEREGAERGRLVADPRAAAAASYAVAARERELAALFVERVGRWSSEGVPP
ncbi:MAG: nucleoside hydrolase, partial [Myxococcota bacterium]